MELAVLARKRLRWFQQHFVDVRNDLIWWESDGFVSNCVEERVFESGMKTMKKMIRTFKFKMQNFHENGCRGWSWTFPRRVWRENYLAKPEMWNVWRNVQQQCGGNYWLEIIVLLRIKFIVLFSYYHCKNFFHYTLGSLHLLAISHAKLQRRRGIGSFILLRNVP